MTSERINGEVHGALDLIRAADKAEGDGNLELAQQLMTDAGDLVDHGNATTYAELAMREAGIDDSHSEFAVIQSIAERCALNGMIHARMERSERNHEPDDGLIWFALRLVDGEGEDR